MLWIEPSKRERKSNYSVDGYFKETMNNGPAKPVKPRQPRAPKQVGVSDFQFFPPRLIELQEKETLAWKKEQGIAAVFPDAQDTDDTHDAREARREAEQAAIDAAEPLTEEEEAEKETLSVQGFSGWHKRHLQQFANAAGKYGRTAYAQIANEIEGKTTEDVEEYSKVFWERFHEIAGTPAFPCST